MKGNFYRNYNFLLFAILIFSLFLLSSYSVNADLTSCSIVASPSICTGAGGLPILRVSGTTNAHSELMTDPNQDYSNVLCCYGSSLTTNGVGSYAYLFNLYDVTDSHVSTDGSYSIKNNVTLGVISGSFHCESINVSGSTVTCPGSDKCVITLSSPNNAHVSDCSNPYSLGICCGGQSGAASYSIHIRPKTANANPGGNVTFSVSYQYPDGHLVDVSNDPNLLLTSSNPNAVLVSGSRTKFKFSNSLTAGTQITITANYNQGGSPLIDTATVNIVNGNQLAYVLISPWPTANVNQGQKILFSLAAYYTNSDFGSDVTSSSSFISSDNSVATMNSNSATGTNAGTTTITGTYSSMSDSSLLNVLGGAGSCTLLKSYWANGSDGSAPLYEGDIEMNRSLEFMIANSSGCDDGTAITFSVYYNNCGSAITLNSNTGVPTCNGNSNGIVFVESEPTTDINGNTAVSSWYTTWQNSTGSNPRYFFVANIKSNALISSNLTVSSTLNPACSVDYVCNGGGSPSLSCGNGTVDSTSPYNERCETHTNPGVSNNCPANSVCVSCKSCVYKGSGVLQLSTKSACVDDGSGKFGTYNVTIKTVYPDGTSSTSTVGPKQCLLIGNLKVPFFDWINFMIAAGLITLFYIIYHKKED